MRLSAGDCLRRGWTNLSANWELVVIQWLEGFVVAALLALGLVLALLSLGMDALRAGQWTAQEIVEAARRVASFSPPLLMALTAWLAVSLLTLLFHGYFQAGTYGILAAADRQALPGIRRQRLLFRTFSLRDFFGWSGLYVWRFFGMLVLFWGLTLLMAAVVLLWLVFLGFGGLRWGAPAALGIGCGGALPLAFLAVVLGLWLNVGQADLARDGSGVGAAARRGLAVLGRRLGAVCALFVLFLGAAIALAAAFLPLSFLADSLLAHSPGTLGFVRFILLLLQALPNTLLTMLLAGALVALVHSETSGEILRRRRPEVQTA